MSSPLSQAQKIIHFLNRTSFGPTRAEVERVNRSGIRAYLDEQLAARYDCRPCRRGENSPGSKPCA